MAFRALVVRLPAGVACLVLLAGLHPSGAEPAAGAGAREAPRAPAERVTTEVVLIEAYVTDDGGHPIEGLTVDDFTLIVDGRKSPIASLDFRRIPSGAFAPGDRSTLVAAGSIRAAEYPRRFMLFFEDGMSAPEGLTAARHAADRFLSTGLQPSDEVAIAAYDTGLRILHDFSSDREALRRTIAESLGGARRISTEYAESRAHAEELNSEMKRYEQDELMARMKVQRSAGANMQGGAGGGNGGGGSARGSDGAGSSMGPPKHTNKVQDDATVELENELTQIKSLAINYAGEQAVLLRGVLRGVGVLVDALAGWPGYKALVFMGDGVPENPANPYVNAIIVHHPDPVLVNRAQQFSIATDVDSVRRAAAAKGVTIHTLQTRGVGAGTVSEMAAEYQQSNTIAALALSTGGLRSSSNDFARALDEFEASSRAYYVLGYSPSGAPDGRFHAVQVHCRKRGSRVRSREGFTRWTPEEARRRTIQAAHVLPDLFSEMPVDLSAAIGPRDGSARIVDLVAHLPAGSVLFVPEAGGQVARLEVGVVVLDEHGNETFRGARTMQVARPADGATGPVGIDLFRRMRLPDREQTATVVVYDDTTGTVGAVRMPLFATAPEAGGVLGLSLYSVAEQGLWIEMPLDGTPADTRDGPHKTIVGPSVRRTFAVGETPVCGFRRPDPGQGKPAMLEIVIRREGTLVRTVDVPPAEAGSPATAQVTLPVEGLPPGDYTVTVREMQAGGVFDRGTVPLRLRAPPNPPAHGA